MEDLDPGDLLVTPQGQVGVEAVAVWPSAPTLVWELTVAVDHTFAVYAGDHAVVVHNQKECDDAERAAERERRIEELAGDPARGGAKDKGRAEAEVGVALEESGAVTGLVRDPTGAGEFIDADGQAWDVKGFYSTVPPRAKGAFTVEKAMKVDPGGDRPRRERDGGHPQHDAGARSAAPGGGSSCWARRQGPVLAMTTMSREEIEERLVDHHAWDDGRSGGTKLELPMTDLSGIDLSGLDLGGAELAGANFRGACLRDTQFYAASLLDTDLTDRCRPQPGRPHQGTARLHTSTWRAPGWCRPLAGVSS